MFDPQRLPSIWPRWAIAVTTMALAAFLHLAIAPSHFAHSPAHGFFFAIFGFLQAAWVLAALGCALLVMKRGTEALDRSIFGLRLSGLALSGGAVILWLLTQWVRTPFATFPEPIDGPTVLSKAAELIAAVALLLPMKRHRGTRAPLLPASCLILAGLTMWLAGLGAEKLLPELKLEYGIDNGNHVHPQDLDPPSFSEFLGAAVRLFATLRDDSNYSWQLPPGFPEPRVPANNPMTAPKVDLGRYLFYDERLAGNSAQSCASCHQQQLAFSDGLKLARGSTDEIHPRNSMALVNVAYNASLTWAHPNFEQLENQIPTPMFGSHPIELGITGNEEVVLERLRGDETYKDLFRGAFPADPDPFTWDNIVKALASFNRILISGDSPYDRFVYQGNVNALSASARRGMELFLSEDFECHHCHGGFNFTVASVHRATAFDEKVFHNTGLYDLGKGAYPLDNQGVFEFTQDPKDMGKFRPPTLRNVALTAPYMHDGSIATLEEVIDTYAAGGRHIEDGPLTGDGRRNPHKSGFVPGFPISEQEKEDLLAFLQSLTDETFITDPRFANPFEPEPPLEQASLSSPVR